VNFRGVIFDMDGTITEPFFDFHAIEVELGIFGVDLVDHMASVSKAERDRIRRVLRKHEDHAAENAPIRAGAAELLTELKRRKVPTALLTRNTRRSIEILCRRLRLKFNITLSREDGRHFKPKPEPVWFICRRWKISPADVLLVGDYKYDIECGKAAGCKTALVVDAKKIPDWGRDADYFVRHLLELRPILGLDAERRRPTRKRTTRRAR
jgi:HAD superfamily hydrolase (TIGR01549 family)